MKIGDLVKVKDGFDGETEGVICDIVKYEGEDKFLIYSFEEGEVFDNPNVKSHMLVAENTWLFVKKEDAYNVINKKEIGPYEFEVEKK